MQPQFEIPTQLPLFPFPHGEIDVNVNPHDVTLPDLNDELDEMFNEEDDFEIDIISPCR